MVYLIKEFLLQDDYIALAYVAKMHISCILFIFVTESARHAMRVFFFFQMTDFFIQLTLSFDRAAFCTNGYVIKRSVGRQCISW